jgi:DNA-binding transcriptional ArsR family regulator
MVINMTEIKKLQAIFQTLSDYNRLSIVKALCDKECSVGEIVFSAGLSQPLVSHHLRVFKENDFLVTKRKLYKSGQIPIFAALCKIINTFR